MSGARRCTSCGATIPSGRGECPRCLLELAVSPATDSDTPEAAPATRRAPPPSAEELAASFPQLEILSLLGEGGMGVVYRARHRQLEREVALKILAPGADDPRFAERFLREARTLARLDHPGIVGVHDFGTANGRPYLSMELVDGTSLRERMRAGRIPPGEALALVGQICEALQYAHDEGVVHRDIKPENVLIDRKGRVKLVDFGLAKLVLGNDASRATETGVWMGTPSYMAPEQLRGTAAVDHRADLYSLGVVLYEMLTGELPRRDPALSPQRILVDLRFDRVVLKSLEQAPERRYQHALEIRTDLEQDRPADLASAAGPGAPRRHRALVLSGYAVALLVLWRLTWLGLAGGPLVLGLGVVAIAGVGCRMLRGLVGRDPPASRRAAHLATAVAAVLLALAGGAWIAHTLRLWEGGTASYAPPPHEPERLVAMGPQALGELAAAPELLSTLRFVPTRRDVLDVPGWLRWPGFAALALGLWLAASAVALRARREMPGRARWGSSLAATGVLGLAALLGSLPLPHARGAWPAEELAARQPVSADTLDEVEARLRLWLLEEEFQVETALYWDIHERDSGRPLGRAALLLAQAPPFDRWRFRLWAGPERMSPRVLGLLTELFGTPQALLHAGSLAPESSDAVLGSEWRSWLAAGARRL